MKGWRGRMLLIDLTSGNHRFESIDPGLCRSWIGGKGLAGHYLYPEITRSWDDPGLPLVFMTGPLTATASPASGRTCVASRSPLTGTIGDCSVGGSLGWQLRRAGIDGIVITGRRGSLCGIEIADGEVSIEDARRMAGMTVDRLHAGLKRMGAVACIGPAAENG
ncbi:MAG: hypothetical protein JXA64_09745, partial [Candidatus Fermentibacteraceae bacterium]|nr:hypothetical protein [Candidatus Fermentibacteraceae bacterium]